MGNLSYMKKRAKKYAASASYAKADFVIIASEKNVIKCTPIDYESQKIAIMKNTSCTHFVKTLKGSIIVGLPATKPPSRLFPTTQLIMLSAAI